VTGSNVLRGWKKSIQAWKNVKRYLREAAREPSITFFSEGQPYHPFLHPVISNLRQTAESPILYITSDENDSYLLTPPQNVQPFFIGKGAPMIYLFTNTNTRLMIMTMPDLNKFHIKKSVHPVHYVYIFHSIVSTHMVYRQGAFDHFDSVLCVGPHHKAEIRAAEILRGLPEKNLINHGYGPLDTLLKNDAPIARNGNKKTNILIAPSWGTHSIIETVGEKLVSTLLAANFVVTVRPHPRTRQINPDLISQLSTQFGSNKSFRLDTDTSHFDSLLTADLMVSDWSGAALEFSLGLQKPVLFIDVPAKVNNPSWQDLNIIPLEDNYRSQVGEILSPEHIDLAPEYAARLLSNRGNFARNIEMLRKTHIYNLGKSGSEGARTIQGMLQDSLKTYVKPPVP
tara:strand:- start:32324 stop:33517 length:1194 start_codon:yes stop_codon:yes gene_type:complete